MEIFEGAYGGRNGLDGMDAIDTLYANTRNNPIEDLETHLPLRIERYELRDDAHAAGRWRGGLGSVREFTYTEAGGASIEGEGHTFRPWGLGGGADGATASLLLQRSSGTRTALPSKVPHTKVGAGDKFIVVGPVGGGYGDPMLRDPERVRDDALDGFISKSQARELYGVGLSDSGEIDEAATAALRGGG